MLNETIFLNGMTQIEKRWDRKFSKDQIDVYYKFLKQFDDSVFVDAVKKNIFSGKSFPTPEVLVKLSDDAETELARQRAAIKQRDQRKGGFLSGKTNRPDCNPVISAVMDLFKRRHVDKTIDSFKLSEELYELDKKFPGRGLRKAADNIYNQWAQRNGLSRVESEEFHAG